MVVTLTLIYNIYKLAHLKMTSERSKRRGLLSLIFITKRKLTAQIRFYLKKSLNSAFVRFRINNPARDCLFQKLLDRPFLLSCSSCSYTGCVDVMALC